MLDRVIRIFASLKLAVVCLTLAMLLVFIGTIAQVEEGLYNAQNRYFRSVLIYWQPQGADWKVPVFPGGYLIGSVLLLNLITAYSERLKMSRSKTGLFMAHGGLVLLVVGQFASDMLQVESFMRVGENQPKFYSESNMRTELAVTETSNPHHDEVVAIPERFLARREDLQHPQLPFTIRVKTYHQNSRLGERASDDKEPAAATEGVGPRVKFTPVPPAIKMDERNVPAAIVELLTPKGSLGTWVVSLALSHPQDVQVGGKTYTLALRPTRYYKSHSLTLLKFSHDKYRGTDIPKNFSSRVRVQRPDTGEDREVLIYMNNPLRYAGETYYQSGYDERDPRISILQVVRNPSWLTPYLACGLVGLGLCIQFMAHLLDFMRKRKTA
ncbi:MAG: cytochrome c biogenesis protein ResB [Verrucomicrobia bacterium]|nr:cytochrome c biogenesis protein ResB [Verrucomicrobiota bacterium]